MPGSAPNDPVYSLQTHTPVDDDSGWSIVKFEDAAEGGIGGLTITVSEATLERLLSGDLNRPLTGDLVMGLDGT